MTASPQPGRDPGSNPAVNTTANQALIQPIAWQQVRAMLRGTTDWMLDKSVLARKVRPSTTANQVLVTSTDTDGSKVSSWANRGRHLMAASLGTSGFFAIAYANIYTPVAVTVVSGRTYIVELTGDATDGASGATRNSDFRFTDGTTAFGGLTVQTLTNGFTAVCLRGIYTATSSGSITFFPQAQCVSGTPAVRMAGAIMTVIETEL